MQTNIEYGINGAIILADFNVISYEEWQAQRKQQKQIGGSDAAVIMGTNKYKNQARLYLEKLGEIEPEEAGEAAYWGHTLEPIIADEFQKRHPEFDVVEYKYLLQHPQYEFMVGNVDRLIQNKETGEYGLLEIKTVSEYKKEDWANDRVPDYYYPQIQHYFAITGLRFAYFAALVGGNKYIERYVERDDEYIDNLIFQEEAFWWRLENKVPPELDGSESSAKLVQALYPQATEEKEVKEFDEEMGALLVKRQQLKKQIDELKGQLEECNNKIKAYMAEMKKGIYFHNGIQYSVSYGNVKGKPYFDANAFKTEHPDLYQKFVREGEPTRQLRVTEKQIKGECIA
jgi:putative phage-type endonuclease